MKQGFPHCATSESVELVQTQSCTLLLEVLGNHQVLLPGHHRAATFISQYMSFLLVVVSKQMVLCLQGQMRQDSPASSIPTLDESRIMVGDFNFRFYQGLEWHFGVNHVVGLNLGYITLRILDLCFETRPRKYCFHLSLHQEKSKIWKCWFGFCLKHSLKLSKRVLSLPASASPFFLTWLGQTNYSNDRGHTGNVWAHDQGWACKWPKWSLVVSYFSVWSLTRLSSLHVPVLWLLLRRGPHTGQAFQQVQSGCGLLTRTWLAVAWSCPFGSDAKVEGQWGFFVPYECDNVVLAYVLAVHLESWHMERKKSKTLCQGMS